MNVQGDYLVRSIRRVPGLLSHMGIAAGPAVYLRLHFHWGCVAAVGQ